MSLATIKILESNKEKPSETIKMFIYKGRRNSAFQVM
jgi:hypothetical protein